RLPKLMAWVSLDLSPGKWALENAGMFTTRSRGSEVRYALFRPLVTCRIITVSECGCQVRTLSRVSTPTSRMFSGPLMSAPGNAVGLVDGDGAAPDADGVGVPNRSVCGIASS